MRESMKHLTAFTAYFSFNQKCKKKELLRWLYTSENYRNAYSAGKESTCNEGDPGLFPGSEDPLEKRETTHSSILGLPWWL